MKVSAPLIVFALCCMGLTACNDKPEEPATVTPQVSPQPVHSAPAPNEVKGPSKVTETQPAPQEKEDSSNVGSSAAESSSVPEGQSAADAPQQATPISPNIDPNTDAVAAPATPSAGTTSGTAAKPVPATEVVPAEQAPQANPSPTAPAASTPAAPDPAAEVRADPIPDEYYADQGQELPSEPSDIYFPNCAAAEAGGFSAMQKGEAGYSPELDDDGDGVACE